MIHKPLDLGMRVITPLLDYLETALRCSKPTELTALNELLGSLTEFPINWLESTSWPKARDSRPGEAMPLSSLDLASKTVGQESFLYGALAAPVAAPRMGTEDPKWSQAKLKLSCKFGHDDLGALLENIRHLLVGNDSSEPISASDRLPVGEGCVAVSAFLRQLTALLRWVASQSVWDNKTHRLWRIYFFRFLDEIPGVLGSGIELVVHGESRAIPARVCSSNIPDLWKSDIGSIDDHELLDPAQELCLDVQLEVGVSTDVTNVHFGYRVSRDDELRLLGLVRTVLVEKQVTDDVIRAGKIAPRVIHGTPVEVGNILYFLACNHAIALLDPDECEGAFRALRTFVLSQGDAELLAAGVTFKAIDHEAAAVVSVQASSPNTKYIAPQAGMRFAVTGTEKWFPGIGVWLSLQDDVWRNAMRRLHSILFP